jgi:hypothetical protein
LTAALGAFTALAGCSGSADRDEPSTSTPDPSLTDTASPTATPCPDQTPTEYYPDLRAYNLADRELTIGIEVQHEGTVVLRRDVSLSPRSGLTVAETLYETGKTYTIRASGGETVLAEAAHEGRDHTAAHDYGPIVQVDYDGELTAEIEVHQAEWPTPPACAR